MVFPLNLQLLSTVDSHLFLLRILPSSYLVVVVVGLDSDLAGDVAKAVEVIKMLMMNNSGPTTYP